MKSYSLRIASLAAALSLCWASQAKADISGFSTFAPVNSANAAAAVGLDPNGTQLTLTDGQRMEATSVFSSEKQSIRAFTASFVYKATRNDAKSNQAADGIAFVVQNDPRGTKALGDTGGPVGYGEPGEVTKSFAIKLGIYGGSSEGIGTDGVFQSMGDTGSVDLLSGHPILVIISYNGGTVTETLTDQTTHVQYSDTYDVDIPAQAGANTAYVGLSGGSGDETGVQSVSDFTFVSKVPTAKFVPPAPVKVKVIKHDSRVSYVDPFIGTDGGGNTFPGASAPFGMVQFSPDTSAPSIGYVYNDRNIQGFSMNHMSGVGCNDQGDVFMTATTGDIKTNAADYESRFSHADETASPGYYQVMLSRWKINAEVTATERAGAIRFTFPKGVDGNILIPISHTLTSTRSAEVHIIGNNEVAGKVTSQSFCGAPQYYSVYFIMRLSRPFKSFGTMAGDDVTAGARTAEQFKGGPDVGGYLTFDNAADNSVTADIGISYVDEAGARANLAKEIANKNFDQIRAQAAKTWESALNDIDVFGGTVKQTTVFYTCLYHAMLMPSVFNDVDGRYVGFDNQIHSVAPGHNIYDNYSGWDIYRTQAPLMSLIEPDRMADMCQSINLMYTQGGWIDRWPQANTYTEVMNGSPLTVVASTAWRYGIKNFDMTSLYGGMLLDATTSPPPGKPYYGESNIKYMDTIGYIPDDKEGYGAVSQTQEDCIAYAALATVAQSLGKTADAKMLTARAMNYKNVFDPDTKFFRPRNADGTWVSPFDPVSEAHYVEGSGWHYRWLVPEDVQGMINLFGGDETFNTELAKFFGYTKPSWDDHFYNPLNETDLEAPWLADYSGQPWMTQSRVRELMRDAYRTTPDGIPGNDDCGTMSAWGVFGSIGFYPTNPADGSLELCSPVFTKAVIHVGPSGHRKTFTVNAPSASTTNQYISALKLNTSTVNATYLMVDDILKGGTLDVNLGSVPNKSWADLPTSRPPSLTK